MALKLALNRTMAPHRDLDGFLALAKAAGVEGVEIRNDIEGQEFANGLPARELAARVAAAGLSIASINALQRFNDWSAERAVEARALIDYAGACGAPGLVLCPVVDADDKRDAAQWASDLRRSLKALAPMLADNGVTGLVEPLGMVASSLRFKADAVQAIGDVDGFKTFGLCHDTFQHYRCGDTMLFPEYTRMVHISGVVEPTRARDALVEPDRGLVGPVDRAGNLEQLRILIGRGYQGFVSFEPFDPELQRTPDPLPALQASMAHLARHFA